MFFDPLVFPSHTRYYVLKVQEFPLENVMKCRIGLNSLNSLNEPFASDCRHFGKPMHQQHAVE